jgi:hypothetical protein
MFGSNFGANFGLPDFPLQGMDPQGGYLGVNVEPSAAPAAAGSAVGGLPGGPVSSAPPGPTPGSPVPAPQPSLGSPLAQPSPLAPGAAAQSLGGAQPDSTTEPAGTSQQPTQVAQSSPIQMQPMGNGMVRVIDIRTGQVLYTGSPSGAANAQASHAGRVRRIIED